MKVQIKSISGHQTSKVVAIMFAVFTLPFMFVSILGLAFAPTMHDQNGETIHFPWLLFVFAPVFYGLIGYFFNRLGCFIYNLISQRIGGIEFTTEEQ